MAEPVVEARALERLYLQGERPLQVLRGLDLEVAASEFVAVLGPSGSGKSTLLNLLGLMDRPTGGSLRLCGEDPSALSEDRRAALRSDLIGFVFQFDSLLPEFTVLENVTLPARLAGVEPRKAEEKAMELLEPVGVKDLADRFPTFLSGGERQRVAIARALINEPALLLADEPTGNLDRPNAELVFSNLKDLADSRGVAVVMVTHNETAAGFASRPIHLSDGRIAETALEAGEDPS